MVGAKLGLASVAKQEQMGVTDRCCGWVLASSVLDDEDLQLDELIHPRVEPERASHWSAQAIATTRALLGETGWKPGKRASEE